MSYLVMECHPGYAVVLDSSGRFLKVANLNYEVGQTVSAVLQLKDPAEKTGQKSKIFRLLLSAAAVAACVCFAAAGAWRYLLTPYGSVRMQINPDVQMTVNRMDYVLELKGLNEDGVHLIDGYDFDWKKVDRISDELADRAVEMGYLKEAGEIRLTVESEHEKWRAKTEERILIELEVHLGGEITVTAETSSAGPETEIVIPVTPAAPEVEDDEDEWGEDSHEDRDDDESDDGDGEDDESVSDDSDDEDESISEDSDDEDESASEDSDDDESSYEESNDDDE